MTLQQVPDNEENNSGMLGMELKRTATLTASQRPKSVADVKNATEINTSNSVERKSISEERKTVTPKQSPVFDINVGKEKRKGKLNELIGNVSIRSGGEVTNGYVRYSTKRSKEKRAKMSSSPHSTLFNKNRKNRY